MLSVFGHIFLRDQNRLNGHCGHGNDVATALNLVFNSNGGPRASVYLMKARVDLCLLSAEGGVPKVCFYRLTNPCDLTSNVCSKSQYFVDDPTFDFERYSINALYLGQRYLDAFVYETLGYMPSTSRLQWSYDKQLKCFFENIGVENLDLLVIDRCITPNALRSSQVGILFDQRDVKLNTLVCNESNDFSQWLSL